MRSFWNGLINPRRPGGAESPYLSHLRCGTNIRFSQTFHVWLWSSGGSAANDRILTPTTGQPTHSCPDFNHHSLSEFFFRALENLFNGDACHAAVIDWTSSQHTGRAF